MSTGTTDSKEPELHSVPVYQAPQAQARFMYVPIVIFFGEVIFALLGMRLIGPWALLFVLPVHGYLVMLTSANQHWVGDSVRNLLNRRMVSNLNVRGRQVVTFTPHTTRRELKTERKAEIKALKAAEKDAKKIERVR